MFLQTIGNSKALKIGLCLLMVFLSLYVCLFSPVVKVHAAVGEATFGLGMLLLMLISALGGDVDFSSAADFSDAVNDILARLNTFLSLNPVTTIAALVELSNKAYSNDSGVFVPAPLLQFCLLFIENLAHELNGDFVINAASPSLGNLPVIVLDSSVTVGTRYLRDTSPSVLSYSLPFTSSDSPLVIPIDSNFSLRISLDRYQTTENRYELSLLSSSGSVLKTYSSYPSVYRYYSSGPISPFFAVYDANYYLGFSWLNDKSSAPASSKNKYYVTYSSLSWILDSFDIPITSGGLSVLSPTITDVAQKTADVKYGDDTIFIPGTADPGGDDLPTVDPNAFIGIGGALIGAIGAAGLAGQDLWTKIHDVAVTGALEASDAQSVSLSDTAAIEFVDTAVAVGPVILPDFGVSIPSLNLPRFKGIWHYVREWLNCISGGWSLIRNVWSHLPYCFLVPLYAAITMTIVFGLYRKLF